MKAAVLRWTLAALVAAGVYGLFAWDHSAARAGETGPVEKAQEAGWNALVGAGEAKAGPTWSYTVKPDEKLRKKMAKAPIGSGVYGGSATLEITVWNGQTPLQGVQFITGNAGLQITLYETTATDYVYTFMLTSGMEMPSFQQVAVAIPEQGQEATYSWIWTWHYTGAQLDVASQSYPIGDKVATHAKEMGVVESWQVPAGAQITTSVSGSGGASLTRTTAAVTSSMDMAISELTLTYPGDFPTLDNAYIAIRNMSFCGNPINTSNYPEQNIHGGQEGENTWVRTDGAGGFEFFMKPGPSQGGADAWLGVSVLPPYSHDFGHYYAKFMDEQDYDPVVSVECLRRLNAEGYDIGPWKGYLSQLRALGRVTQSSGCNSWDTRDPDVNGNVAMYLDRNSAERDGIDVGFGRPDLKVEGAGWLAPRVNGLYNPETPSPVDGDYWEDGNYNGEPIYVNGNGYKIWCKDSYLPVWAIGYGPGTASAYEQDGAGPQGAYLYGDLPNLVWNPALGDGGDWDDITEPPPIGYTSLDPIPAVSSTSSGTLVSAGVPSFSHDLTCVFDAHTLRATSRTQSPYVYDIFTIEHEETKGIYGVAHDATDWTPTGAGTTAPDANGRFTIATPGDYLRLDLKQNFIGRQAAVGQLNAIPVPTAYWIRRHDGLVGSGDPPETAEAAYCWLGWGYLHIPLLLDDNAINVTTRLFYYDDVGGASDNHKTDSTRQTEYSYSAGSLHTLTRNTLVLNGTRVNKLGREWWGTTVVVDLHAPHALAVVTAIEIAFDLGGVEYVLEEPYLATDTGDENETNRTVITHLLGDVPWGNGIYGGGPNGIRTEGRKPPTDRMAEFKAFENWRYAEGGLSGHFNGMYRRALWNLDNHKANATERTLGYLLPLYGAKTGIDMTTCMSVETVAGLVAASSEAWITNFNSAAQDSAFKDVDGVWLKVPAGSDIVPTMRGGMGGPAIANRVYSITAVAGLPYTHYGCHYVQGRAQGMMTHPVTGLRRRSTGSVTILAREAGNPDAAWGTVDGGFFSDQHGKWESRYLSPVRNLPQHKRQVLEYAAMDESMTTPVVMGIVSSREWTEGDVTNKPYGDASYCRDVSGITSWRAVMDDGKVVVHYLDGYDKTGWLYTGEAFAQSEDNACPWISSCEDGSLLCGVTDLLSQTIKIKRSRDGGYTWGAEMATLGDGLMFGRGITMLGQTYLPGWYNGAVYLAVSSQEDLAREVLDGTSDLLKVCDAPQVVGDETPRSHVLVQETGRVDVLVDDATGTTKVYRCSNWRDGFTLIA